MSPTNRPLSRILEVTHITSYSYDTLVERSSHRYRLSPVQDAMQRVDVHSVAISADGVRFRFEDVFGNDALGFETTSLFNEITVSAHSVVEVFDTIDRPELLPDPQTLPLMWMPWQRQMMLPYLLPVELAESELREITDFAMTFVQQNDLDVSAALDDLNQTIHREFSYQPGFTTLETTPYEVLRHRAGVCQDFANLFICAARLLNVPARYRVGYVYTGADYENTIQSEASHAWAEVFLPLMGWRGYDPTNGCRVGADHVRVAAGRNYRDATPTQGVIYAGGGGERMTLQVKVEDRTDSGV
jgi:transglutaminase-like putative cysteine protease